MDAPQNAVVTIPSIAAVCGEECLGWLADLVRTAPHDVAWSASRAVIDWFCQTQRRESAATNDVFEALISRYEEPAEPYVAAVAEGGYRVDLRASLLWAMGAAAVSEVTLSRAATVIAVAYAQGRGLEDAAAVRATIVLENRWGQVACERVYSEVRRADEVAAFPFARALGALASATSQASEDDPWR